MNEVFTEERSRTVIIQAVSARFNIIITVSAQMKQYKHLLRQPYTPTLQKIKELYKI